MWDNSAFNHNQTFLSGEGLQTETGCGLLSPLRATCHRSSGHWSRSSPLPPAIWVCAPDVWYGHLQPLKWLTLCVYMHASLCVCVSVCVCSAILLSSSLCCLPLVGHDTDSDSCASLNYILSWQTNKLKVIMQEIHLAFELTWLELTASAQFRSHWTTINHFHILLILSLDQLEHQEVK